MIARRPLGASGISAPVLGFGVSGPLAGGLVPARRAAALIGQALDAGVALFDTAPFYGDGEGERRLGAALAGRRDRALICTKAGTIRAGAGLAKDFSPQHLTASLEASLGRLGTDHVDLFLLHGPAEADLRAPSVLEALQGLKAAGKTRLTGVCGRGPEIEAAIAAGAFDVVMIPVGAEAGETAARRTAEARAAGLGVIGIEALAGAAPAWRIPRSAADLWYLARAMRRGAGGQGAPAATPEAALEAALDGTRCDAALTTTTRPAHLAANIAAAARVSA